MGNALLCGARANEIALAHEIVLAEQQAVARAGEALVAAKTESEKQAARSLLELVLAEQGVARARMKLAAAKTESQKQAAESWFQLAKDRFAAAVAKQKPDGENDFNLRVARSPSVRALENHIETISPQIRNYWAIDNKKGLISSPQRGEKDGLRTKAAKHYRCAKKIGKVDGKDIYSATCCVTGVEGDNRQVIPAHLLPCSSPPMALEFFNMEKGFDDFRNLVLLAANIEKAYDSQRLCFVMAEDGEILLRILDESVKEEPIFEGSDKKIGEYEGRPMKFEDGVDGKPFSRILSCHAKYSFYEAKTEGWISLDAEMASEFKYGSPLKDDLVLRVLNEARSFSDSGSIVSLADTSTTGDRETLSS